MNESVHQEIVKLRQELNSLGFGQAAMRLSFYRCYKINYNKKATLAPNARFPKGI